MKKIRLKNLTYIALETDIYSDIEYKNIEIELDMLFKKNKNQNNWIKNNPDLNNQEALWFGNLDYKYGKYKTLKSTPLPEFIKLISKKVSLLNGFEKDYFNSVYINKFFNGGIGKHHDNDNIFKTDDEWLKGKEIVVSSLSIGGTAKISIFENYNIQEPFYYIDIKGNTLYTMGENFQNNLLHKVGISRGVRYSLTFRKTISR